MLTPDAAARLAASFHTTLVELTADPGRYVADVPVVAPSIGPTRWPCTPGPIGRRGDGPHRPPCPRRSPPRWPATPGAPAIIGATGNVSYAELDRQSTQLAHVLVRCGVRADEPVAVLLDRSAGFVIAVLAVLKAGAAYVPVTRAIRRPASN